MQIRSIGIDLGKTTFHLVGLGERGKSVIRKKLSRKQLLAFLPPICRHHWSDWRRAPDRIFWGVLFRSKATTFV